MDGKIALNVYPTALSNDTFYTLSRGTTARLAAELLYYRADNRAETIQ
jgi:hypothetical protein